MWNKRDTFTVREFVACGASMIFFGLWYAVVALWLSDSWFMVDGLGYGVWGKGSWFKVQGGFIGAGD